VLPLACPEHVEQSNSSTPFIAACGLLAARMCCSVVLGRASTEAALSGRK
jgi:hypothetical protein